VTFIIISSHLTCWPEENLIRRHGKEWIHKLSKLYSSALNLTLRLKRLIETTEQCITQFNSDLFCFVSTSKFIICVSLFKSVIENSLMGICMFRVTHHRYCLKNLHESTLLFPSLNIVFDFSSLVVLVQTCFCVAFLNKSYFVQRKSQIRFSLP
jgi:hypothetical protein